MADEHQARNAGATKSEGSQGESAQSLSSFLTALQGLTRHGFNGVTVAPCDDGEYIRRDTALALLAGVPEGAAPGAPDVRGIIEALGFDPTNHHNALACPYCNPEKVALVPLPGAAASAEADDTVTLPRPLYEAYTQDSELLDRLQDDYPTIRQGAAAVALPSPPDGWQADIYEALAIVRSHIAPTMEARDWNRVDALLSKYDKRLVELGATDTFTPPPPPPRDAP